MSSHHIVKEKQEPALYIDELGNFSEELLGQLLEWSPTVLVNGSNHDKILSLGLKVDIVVNAENILTQEHTKVIVGKGDALHTALTYLIQEKYPAVNIITGTFDLERFAGTNELINLVVFTETQKTYAIKPGFSVWKPKDTIINLWGNSYVELTNLKENQNDSFSVIHDGFIQFDFAGAPIFISEQL